jgi:hypothetical protein
VDEIIAKEPHLNICFDGASNIAHQRVLNISVGTQSGFLPHNVILGRDPVSGEYQREKVLSIINTMTNSQPESVNSISGDTCPGMRKTIRLLESSPEFRPTFTIPCDPHGLQLLLGDILPHTSFAPAVKGADSLIDHLHHADKQYQILKDCPRKYLPAGKEPRVMVIRLRTRWGTERSCFKRIIDSEMARRSWVADSYVHAELTK